MRKTVTKLEHEIKRKIDNYIESFLFGRRLSSLSNDIAKSDTSYAGEFGIIAKLLENKDWANLTIVDIAASDGVTQSPVLQFIKAGASGLAVEVDGDKFAALAYLYRKFPKMSLHKTRISPQNVTSILEHSGIKRDLDVMNIDIDSFDLDLVVAILQSEYRPQIISIEINEKIPPPIYFNVLYSDNHSWDGTHFYGCSLTAATSKIEKFGYKLVELEFNNAIFVRSDKIATPLSMKSPSSVWLEGYRNRPETKKLFGHNSDVEHWLDMSPEPLVHIIRDYFSEHNGKFDLFIED
jgi:hypothetical protein